MDIQTYTPDLSRPYCPTCGSQVEPPAEVTDPTQAWIGHCSGGHRNVFQMDDELTEDELFNCCADSTEPDWGEYEGLEVAGVLEYTHHIGGEDYCEALGPDDKRAPDFYSVYARGREGFADCITDVPLDGDLVGIFRELQERSGLPLLVNWTTVDL